MDQLGESACSLCLADMIWKWPRSFLTYWCQGSFSLQQIYLQIYKKEQGTKANNLISLKNNRKAEMEQRNSLFLNIFQRHRTFSLLNVPQSLLWSASGPLKSVKQLCTWWKSHFDWTSAFPFKKIYYRNWLQCSYLAIWEEKRQRM